MGIFDPETGLRYCEKHSWEQADDCLYCANESLRKEVERLTGVKGRLERGHDKLVEKIYDLRKEVERLREDLERGCIIDRGDGTDDVCQIYAENADLRKAKGGTVVPYNDGAR